MIWVIVLLKKIASIILKVISKEDIAIRYGGDEFVIITNYSSKDLSTKITDEVFSFFEYPHSTGDYQNKK